MRPMYRATLQPALVHIAKAAFPNHVGILEILGSRCEFLECEAARHVSLLGNALVSPYPVLLCKFKTVKTQVEVRSQMNLTL